MIWGLKGHTARKWLDVDALTECLFMDENQTAEREVSAWIVHTRFQWDDLYLLITVGERWTGGVFQVHVHEVEKRIVVHASVTRTRHRQA